MGQPDWTDLNEGDPGSPLVQVFGFLGDSLLFRADARERRRRLAVVAVAAGLGLLWWSRRGDGG